MTGFVKVCSDWFETMPGFFSSLKWQLLVSVNLVLALAVFVLLLLDAHQEYASRLRDKQIALSEEAKVLLAGVLHIERRGQADIQTFVDEVCGKMSEDQSPGHHVVVGVNGAILQAQAHHRASPTILKAMVKGEQAANHQAVVAGETLVVGSARHNDHVVFVSEYLSTLHQQIVRQLLWRLVGILVLVLLAVVVVNAVLLRLVARPIESITCVVRRISQGELGAQTDYQGTTELAYLANAINSMSRALAEVESERKAQLTKARSIQNHWLPKIANADGIKVAYLYQPAADISGDFFDVRQMSNGTWLFCIADVTGHGISAAMGVMILKTLFLEACERVSSPKEILSEVNDRFVTITLPEDFASMFIAQWDSRNRCLEYASAGHEPAYLQCLGGKIEQLKATGMLLGLQETCYWETVRIPVAQGDRLYLVTDGLTDTFGSNGTLFGRDNLFRLLHEQADQSLESKVEEIDQTLTNYRGHQPQKDDLTLLLIEFIRA